MSRYIALRDFEIAYQALRKTIAALIQDRGGPARARIGNRAYYYRPDVEAWLASQFGATQ